MFLFKTNDFSVRPFVDSDACDCEKFLADPEVMKFIGDGGFRFEKTNALEMVHWFQKSGDPIQGLGTWAVVSNESGIVVGSCHLSKTSATGGVEFGISLQRSLWGKGHATQICQSLLDYGFQVLGLNSIVATVHPRNFASQKMLVKLGYRFERPIQAFGVEHHLYLKTP
jgi:ribosomal-protein-alanine N-acetyltransferase